MAASRMQRLSRVVQTGGSWVIPVLPRKVFRGEGGNLISGPFLTPAPIGLKHGFLGNQNGYFEF